MLSLFGVGALRPLPVTAWDVRRAPEAFRFMSQACHVGKNVLTLPATIEPSGTVLITGGTGGLGALLAEHLVAVRGIRHLLLCSRRGRSAKDAEELSERLSAMGADAQIVACDVSDRAQVESLLKGIDPDHPLTAVVHAAGVLDDGVLQSLTAERVRDVLSPKVNGAWNLHELTRDLDLSAFVMFSSIVGSLGAAGQASYAAANAFLDVLAVNRRVRGLPALSTAWGPWTQVGGMADRLDGAGSARLESSGLSSLSAVEGLELFERALNLDEPFVIPVKLDSAALARKAQEGTLPALLRGLTRARRRHLGSPSGSLAASLAGVERSERERIVLELVRAHAAAVLGHASSEAVEPARVFKDLGFDSLAGVELCNRLAAETGLRLSASAVFDHPTPVALARFVLELATGSLPTARHRTGASRAVTQEPIAIVGMACRYPGGVGSPEELWELVASGIDAVSGFPTDRGWDLERLFDSDPDASGTSYACEGGFLDDAADFDAEFFGISPREALAMDPQQRLLLEASWEALEDGGLDPLSLRASDTGVFAGMVSSEYGADPRSWEKLEGYRLTGRIASAASGRVAYTLGLEGPAVSVDTACSSSLVAAHMACQSLRAGECSLALAGGVAISSTPELYIEFSRQHGLAPDGRCKPFANAADGTAWGEGVGMLVLERLSDAQRRGHRVLALVSGSAINQDGASNGLTAPNGPSQQRVIDQALANARLSPAQIDAVEAHGTGTTLGDPIEAQALIATYGRERQTGESLWLGSIKSNIGHTAAASGVAGVIKMVMAMRHGLLPSTLHVDEPSREVDWSSGAVSLLTEQQQWERNGEPRRAGISSFGISGTNAHMIIEEAVATDEFVVPRDPGAGSGRERLARNLGSGHPGEAGLCVLAGDVIAGVTPWVVSGRGESALCGQARRLRAAVVDGLDGTVGDVGFSLTSRAKLPNRAVLLGGDREGLLGGLEALGRGEALDGVACGVARDGDEVVFLFPGQGSQWEGMALELLDRSPLFAQRMAECGDALAPFVDWSPIDVLRGVEGAPSLDRVDVVQPMLFATMVSLAALWRACGVHPDVVVGHSQGEIAAACVAGGLSLADAARVVALRARALGRVAGLGGMVSVALTAPELGSRLERWGDRVSLAAVNGPRSMVVSGDREALDELLAECEVEGVRARRIPVDYAAHSPQVDAVREELLEGLAPIAPRSCEVPFFSTVLGEQIDTVRLDADYWFRNLRETVHFERTVRVLLERRKPAFLEISPHPVLTVGVQETVDAVAEQREVVVAGSLRRGDGGPERFLRSLADVFVRGVDVDWTKVFEGSGGRMVALPTYAFQRDRYWLDSLARGMGDLSAAGLGSAEHPLLGAAVAVAGSDELLFTGRLSLQTHAWLADHVVMDRVVLPGTALLELVLRAAGEVECGCVQELTLQAPLVLPREGAVQLQVKVGEPDESGCRPVAVFAREEDTQEEGLAQAQWTCHAQGSLASEDSASQAAAAAAQALAPPTAEWPPAGAVSLGLDDLYESLAELGLEYGPAFRGLRAAWRVGNELFAEVLSSEEQQNEAHGFLVHPALLDASLHALTVDSTPGVKDGPRVPFSWSGVSLRAVGASVLRVCLSPVGVDAASLTVLDGHGALVLSVDSLVLRAMSAEQLQGLDGGGPDSLYGIEWVEVGSVPDVCGMSDELVVLGLEDGELARWLPDVSVIRDVASLRSAVEGGRPVPGVVLVDCAECWGSAPAGVDGGVPSGVHASVLGVLGWLQEWLADERFVGCRLVIVTCGAVAARAGEKMADLAGGAVWGLVRSAQSENPGRFVLLDTDVNASQGLVEALPVVLGCGEDRVAVRGDGVLVPRLVRAGSDGSGLTVPAGVSEWCLRDGEGGSLDDLSLVAAAEPGRVLGEGEVRVGVRAAGLNFRDVLVALGVVNLDAHPGSGGVGGEGAGVVLGVGPGVVGFQLGDRVMGLFDGAFGPVAVADQRLLAGVPDGWSFAQAASVPIAFLTAYYALVDLAGVREGERLLVHAGAGGVGMAAIQLARHLGVEVFATASTGKWDVLRGMGLDEDRIASSRDLGFAHRFLDVSDGQGMDVVLDCLAGEFVDASLGLLGDGGRFIEMGKTDIRDPVEVASAHPGVLYRAFDLFEAGPERIREMLGELLALFERGVLRALPVTGWDVRSAREAFRFMSQARHVGKNVLTMPARIDPSRTVLITGGTGGLGGVLAEHLVSAYGVRHLLLTSRWGLRSEGAGELLERLAGLGAEVEILACDVSDKAQVKRMLDEGIDQDHPLGTVVHAAGVLDDGLLGSLTAERVSSVLSPKVDGAWNLHELTRDLDLQAFVLFSSLAGSLGSPGQASYAAANSFLDALAAHRRGQGLPAVSLAWGPWAQVGGMVDRLSAVDSARLESSGMVSLSAEQGMEAL